MDIETNQTVSPRKKTRPTKIKDLGPLNDLLVKGLPDWLFDNGMLRTYDLTQYLNVSYQAAYRWFERNRIPPKRIPALVRLSAESKHRPEGFKPLTAEDFLEFLG